MNTQSNARSTPTMTCLAFPTLSSIDDDTTCESTVICYEADPVQEDMQLAI